MSARRVPHGNGDSTTGSESGTDYRVSYTLNQYQRGSMVLRFAQPPGRRELLQELEKYGISSGSVKNLSAAQVPSARMSDQMVRGEVLNFDNEQIPPVPLSTSPLPATPKKPRGCFGPLLSLAVVVFIATSLTNGQSFERGRIVNSLTSSQSDVGERVQACVDALNTSATDSTGFFADRVSTFPLHPANAAFLAGCIL